MTAAAKWEHFSLILNWRRRTGSRRHVLRNCQAWRSCWQVGWLFICGFCQFTLQSGNDQFTKQNSPDLSPKWGCLVIACHSEARKNCVRFGECANNSIRLVSSVFLTHSLESRRTGQCLASDGPPANPHIWWKIRITQWEKNHMWDFLWCLVEKWLSTFAHPFSSGYMITGQGTECLGGFH